MGLPYFLAPFIGWFVSGVVKFLINYIRFGKEAKQRIGNGGFPSTHTTVLVTPTVLIGLSEGFFTPLFGFAVAVCYIVIIDATGLRIHVGKHAGSLNQMLQKNATPGEKVILHRESMGHTKIEILGGIVLGTLLALLLHWLFGLLPNVTA